MTSQNTSNRFRKCAKCLSGLLLLFGFYSQTHAEQQPNIVFVLADDLGWAELGCYGNEFNETPHLDQLAKEGLRFTQAYAAAPVCSPYRAALLTGQHPARIGITDYLRPNSANALPTSVMTLPAALSQNAYSTGMVGKWHLTGYRHHGAEFELRPTDHGFDWNTGSEIKGVGNGANFWPYIFRQQPISWIDLDENRLGSGEYLTDRLNVEALQFIEQSVSSRQPFFLYLSHYAPHTILNGRSDLVSKYIDKHPPGESSREKCYLCEDAGLGTGDPGHHWASNHNPHLAAMLETIDHGVGMISTKLEELGVAENTIFIFTSDNGGETNVTSNAPLRGSKSQLFEGGIRVPLIIRWPLQITPDQTTDIPTQNIDFFPTLLEAAGVQIESQQEIDGISILETLIDPVKEYNREGLFWHYPLDCPHFLGGVSAGAVRSGDWKLVEFFDTGETQLFNIIDDPSETDDLSQKQPMISKKLYSHLLEWRQDVGASIPSPPLITKPRQLYFSEHFHPENISERLWYNADWKAENGRLRRLENNSGNTRIFLRDADYKDAMIRFDFRIGNAQDIRLMTGSGGHYNTVVHIHPDQFFLQTAKDNSVPYFSFRHSECAFEFAPEQWYTMTVEFLGDEAIAHIDHDHVVYGKHPIIDRTREYFAIQVDEHPAEFDNLQIFSATAAKSIDRNRIQSVVNKYPAQKTLLQEFEIRKTNAHEWYYQRDENYRVLVENVEELDALRKAKFPDAFRTHKEYKNAIQQKRKHLLVKDPNYKQLLTATHRANQAIDQWLIAKQPGLDQLPKNRQKASIDQLRSKFADSRELITLVNLAEKAQRNLEVSYAELFVTDQEITEQKKAAEKNVRNLPEFKLLSKQRAEAFQSQQNYLLTIDPELMKLNDQIRQAE